MNLKPLRAGLLALLLSAALSGCVKDRTFSGDPVPTPTPPPPGPAALPVVNEFVVKGSRQTTEFGNAADWLELYNPGATPVVLRAGEWFVTDDAAVPAKQPLPTLTLPARGYAVIWCDSKDTVATQVHTSFNLSASGGDVGLTRRRAGLPDTLVSVYRYATQTVDGASMGRTPDGGSTWTQFATPTPGAANR